MWRHWRICILFAGFNFIIHTAVGQSVSIQSISISGLNRTKASVVLRELTFQEGDTLAQSDLGQIMERNRNNLINMGIFNEAIVNVSEWNTELHQIDITIDLKESWYIYAVPILDLADRNFNVWWTTYNHAFNRLNLGARLEWLNFSGHNDKLKAKIQVGYTPKQEIEYRFPYFNKKKSLGITTGFLHSVNKEVRYATIDNQEQFIRLGERLLQEQWKGEIATTYRPSIFIKYELAMRYRSIKVDQEVIDDFNPSLFRNGDNLNEVFETQFTFEYDHRDLKLFPSKGIKTIFELEKIGWGKSDDENNFLTTLSFEGNITSGRKLQHRFSSIAQYSLSRSRPSYMNYEGLGSSRKYISGYELYVINGLDVVVGKYQLAYKLLEKKAKLGRMMPLEQFRQMPVTFYLLWLAEAGYVNDPFTGAENSFGNRWLYGGGPGLGIVLYHNFLFQFNYSVNHLGEWGLFIHNNTSF